MTAGSKPVIFIIGLAMPTPNHNQIQMNKVSTLAVAVLAFSVCAGAVAGNYRTITIDGDTSDWAGITPAYTDEDGVNNPTGVDFQNVYLANDDNYLYIRFTLMQSADPITPGNTYIWLDNDDNSATGFHPFGNSNFGSSLMIIGDQAYQEAGGGFNEGTLTTANVAYGASSIPGTDFEFKISRSVTGVSGAFSGVSLLDNSTIEVQLASETGSGDSLPSFANYGALSYTFASPVPEPGVSALAGLGLVIVAGRILKARKNAAQISGQPSSQKTHARPN
jgi:hypothetical protein